MTESGRLRRPRYRRWAAACCAILTLGLISGPAAADPGSDAVLAFDLDTGNAPVEIIYPAITPHNKDVSATGSDATLDVDYAMLLEVSWFDAIAPYNPTAVGVCTNLGRRPAAEATDRNRNIAIVYASYRVLLNFLPQFAADWRAMVTSAGLDPNDDQRTTTTAVGIGNLAGQGVIDNRRGDGLNRFGEEGGVRYNRQRYADYTGYTPVNTAYELRDPSRWQPNVVPIGNGIFTVQQFATPQMGLTRPFSYSSPTEFSVAPPVASNYRNRDAYKRQADQVLGASATLDDRQKMTAELFNDKFVSLGDVAGLGAVQTGLLNLERLVQFIAGNSISTFDVAIATWYFKKRFDSVRPRTAIRYLYGNTKLTAWGGPGKGTVQDITGTEWRSYLNTADHPEYPSGSAALCMAFTESARLYLGTDTVHIAVPRPAGSSLVEPGITPATDMTLTWESWSSFNTDCGMSRNWAGVHFLPSIQAPASYAPEIGRRAYQFLQRHIAGQV